MGLFWNSRKRWKGSDRIFCISMQRNGTTSVGDFFEHFDYPVARWWDSHVNKWSSKWLNGDFEAIFSSNEFNSYQVFEDDPWWLPEFYKVLYHRYPKSKFILFYRDKDSWFESMLTHSKGKTPGNTKLHCKIYRRETDYWKSVDNDLGFNPSDSEVDNLLTLKESEVHYKKLYEIRNREILNFFKENDSNRLIACDLKDPDKWYKLGSFFGIDVPKNFSVHSNKSKG